MERLLKRIAKTIPSSIGGHVRTIKRRLYPVDNASLWSRLAALLDGKARCLLVHSSLSACGHIVGGSQVVIDCLNACTDTLVLPTHTYCYSADDRSGESEIFDPAVTPSRVGAISDRFWRLSGVARSVHPTHSIAAIGPASDELCKSHELCETPCGSGTPYVKLIDHGASVLMFGASMNTYTLFHTAEDAARAQYLYAPKPVTVRYKAFDGRVVEMKMRRQDMTVPRQFARMRSILRAEGLLRSTTLGTGELLFIPNSARVHAFIVDKLRKNPWYLVDR